MLGGPSLLLSRVFELFLILSLLSFLLLCLILGSFTLSSTLAAWLERSQPNRVRCVFKIRLTSPSRVGSLPDSAPVLRSGSASYSFKSGTEFLILPNAKSRAIVCSCFVFQHHHALDLRQILPQMCGPALLLSRTEFLILPNAKSRAMCVHDSSSIAITRRIIVKFCLSAIRSGSAS